MKDKEMEDKGTSFESLVIDNDRHTNYQQTIHGKDNQARYATTILQSLT